MHTGTRLQFPYIERHLVLSMPPPDVCQAIEQVCRPLHVSPSILLAVIMVESALRLDKPAGTLSALPARVAQRLYLDHPDWPLELELSATLLSAMLERFSRPLALLAYHLGPESVQEAEETLLGVPLYAAYVRAVDAAERWALAAEEVAS